MLVALSAYWPSLSGPFFSDDFSYVNNAALRAVPLARPWEFLVTRTNRLEFLPLRDLSFRIDVALFGDEPLGYRVHNLVLYALCCLFLWQCARRIASAALRSIRLPEPAASRRADWLATAATALFAAHPAHVESVAWISGRKDLLSGLFALVSLWLFARAIDADRKRGAWLTASCVAFILALLSKSTVAPVALFALFLAADRERGACPRAPAARRVAGMVLPLVAVAAAGVWLHVRFGAETGILLEPEAGFRAAHGPAALLWLKILGVLTRIALFPIELRLVYDVDQPGMAAFASYALGIGCAIGTIAAVWVLWRRPSLAALGVVCFASFSIPFLQLLPFRTWSLASERFLFMPLMGLAVALSAVAVRFRAGAPVLIGVFFLLIAGTVGRSASWASQEELLLGAARLAPGDYSAVRMAVHFVLLPEGRYAEARRVAQGVRDEAARSRLLRFVEARHAIETGEIERAAPLVRRLVESVPRQESGLDFELANMAFEVGLDAEAARLYRSVLEREPGSRLARYNLGLALKRLGQNDEAARQIQVAIDAGLVEARVFNDLGLVSWKLGRRPQAEAAFLEALQREPEHWHAAYNLARLYVEQGKSRQAQQLLGEARRRALAVGDSTDAIDQLRERIAR